MSAVLIRDTEISDRIELTMKIAWGKNSKVKKQSVAVSTIPGLPFGAESDNDEAEKEEIADANTNCPGAKPVETADLLQSQGNKLAEEGKYHEALAKWEATLILTPDNAILHEQKAQVLLEVGDAWRALTAATRATELDPFWPEAWVTLGRAQLNFGEPDSAILTFDKALAIKPDYNEAKADRETAARLIKKRGQLHTSGLSANKRRFTVGEYSEKGAEGEEKGKDSQSCSPVSVLTYNPGVSGLEWRGGRMEPFQDSAPILHVRILDSLYESIEGEIYRGLLEAEHRETNHVLM